ncbi:MAG: lytic transglycosylase domain-containing protein, partial [Gammaproteobacteria bacterium]|nr:lytic transglycosylase domain-containing protein [Gammaproteobacteria bacterium]
MSVEQRRLAFLVLLAAVLVADAPRSVIEPAHAAEHGERVVTAADVAGIVGSVSPTLSPGELDRIGTAVVRYSRKYGLDPELVTAVLLVESSARPWARSPKGAIGLM